MKHFHNSFIAFCAKVPTMLMLLTLPLAASAQSIPSGNISFADANVKELCLGYWDTDGDGELSYTEAAAVTDLGEAFRFNSQITSFNELQYFTGLSSIGDYAFCGCTELTSINIPEALISIGNDAFYGCIGLKEINLPESLLYIGGYAFAYCENLTSVSSLGSVSSLSNCVFMGCTNLSEISIPNTVTRIGMDAFGGCKSLNEITLPNSIEEIGRSAFERCTGLTYIYIPKSVKNIYADSFFQCSGLTRITVEEGNRIYDSRDNCNCIIQTRTLKLIAGCMNSSIPETVTTIMGYAFWCCTGLTSISIPESVTSIEAGAFIGCLNLTDINVAEGNTVYDSRNNCNCIIETATNALIVCGKNTTIPNTVTSIKTSAFALNTNLTSVTIPESVTSIPNSLFVQCDNLTDINVAEGNPIYDSRDNSNCIIETATNTIIAGCKNTVIPNTVTSIGNFAFDHCLSLTSITIPNSVTAIGTGAFQFCIELSSVTSEIEEPFAFGGYAFDGISNNCVLYVPKGTRDAYIAAGWTEDVFKGGVVEMGSDDIDYSTMSDILYIDNVRAASAKQTVVSVILNNSTDISDIQFDLYLPEGVAIANEDGYEIIDVAGRSTAKKHKVNCLEQTDGSVRIMCTSSTGYTFSGNSGAVLLITLDLPSMEDGNYTISLKNCMSSNAENVYHLQDTDATISIVNYVLGDVNADGNINVGDLSLLINMILDKYNTEDYTFRAADVNGDGKLNVGDYSRLVQMILNAPAGSKAFSGAAVKKHFLDN